jgi:hypothetical protein
MVIANNVFVQVAEGTSAFYLTTGGGTTNFTDNCIYRTGKRVGQVTDTGTIIADPMFVNAPGGAYALAAGSPCAGKGASLTSVEQLLKLDSAASVPASTPTDAPSPTATATLTATNTGTATATDTATAMATDTTTARPSDTPMACPVKQQWPRPQRPPNRLPQPARSVRRR